MPVLLRYKAKDVIDSVGKDTINASLYIHYAASFRKAVDTTFTKDTGSGLSDMLRANVSRFAAYKAAHVQRALQEVMSESDEENRVKNARAALRVFDSWQDAEYNTAVARARTAKQFESFMDPDNMRLFPNLRWLASRSANPRAKHVEFYDRVWRKDDPFWNTHTPGTEWNCKCDVEETDDQVTENADIKIPAAPRGLEGNPAKTGEIFTDNASYIHEVLKTTKDCEDYKKSLEYQIDGFWKASSRNSGYDNASLHTQLSSATAKCTIGEDSYGVSFSNDQIDEAIHASMGNPAYVLKNESLYRLPSIIQSSEHIGWSEVDLTHNKVGSDAYDFKKHAVQFDYFKGEIKKGIDCWIHIALMEDGSRRFYTITLLPPTCTIHK